jgi:hypothetical protein
MKRYFYIDAAHTHGLIIIACDKNAAREYVRAEYGYDALPRRHCLAVIA